eukprot:6941476-Lingulodinium_polyedra.AAC.1
MRCIASLSANNCTNRCPANATCSDTSIPRVCFARPADPTGPVLRKRFGGLLGIGLVGGGLARRG